MPSKITDEELSCFLDGELSSDDKVRIENALENDVELQSRLELFLQADEVWKDALLSQSDRAIPPAILKTLGEGKSIPANDNVKFWRLPVAASVAFAFGLTLQSFFNSDTLNLGANMLAGEINRDNPVYLVLESTPSSQSVNLGKKDELTIKPVLTFATNDGKYCREFIVSSDSSATRNIACRQDEQWTVLIASRTRVSSGDSYQTVGADPDQSVDLLIDSIIKGIPFDETAEKELLTQSWKKKE